MSQYLFSAGDLWATPAASGNTPATPIRFGALQDVSIDISWNLKELHGRNQFALAVARGAGKISGKASWAQFNARAFSSIFFGGNNPIAGAVRTAAGEARTISANAATATNGANFVADLGVARASDGVPFVRVTSGPGALEYSCNTTTGVYSFNASNNNVPVLLSYTYADPAAAGSKVTVTNQQMGAAPAWQAVLTSNFDGKSMTLVLEACQSAKLTLAQKLEDFTIPNFDFMGYANAAGSVLSFSVDE